MMYYRTYESPVGILYISANDDGITGLWPETDRYYPDGFKDEMEPVGDGDNKIAEMLNDACEWLDRFFAGEAPEPGELILMPQGTEFQQMVWEELLKIPYGGLTTYGEIAGAVAAKKGIEKMSAQAVGGAVGHNPISIIIPCHRVVGATGSLTGYGGGLDMKISLLETEGVDMSKLKRPTKGTAL